MTTAQQRKFYHPRFRAAAAVHGWKDSLKGADLAATRAPAWGSPDVDKLYAKLWFIALGMAERDEEEFSTSHLRHACNLLASGRKEHSKDLNNRETNRVVALFDLLADPEDLDAMIRWEFPDKAAREGMLVQIRRLAPVAYIISVSRGKFSRDDWENLSDVELSQLLFTLKARARSKAAKWDKTVEHAQRVIEAQTVGEKVSRGAAREESHPPTCTPAHPPVLVEEPF